MTGASLLLCHRLPYPPDKGDKIRSFALLRHLANKGPVHVACFVDAKEDLKYCDEVRRMAGGKCYFEPIGRTGKWLRAAKALLSAEPITTSYFASRYLARWVKELVARENIGNIVVFGSAMAPYLLDDQINARRVLFDMVDVDSDKWRQYAGASRGLLRWIYAREARAVARLECDATCTFGRTLLVSSFECATLQAMVPGCANRIGALNNGVDLSFYSPGIATGCFSRDEIPIVMTGRMDYRPNYEGAVWFATKVAPRIFSVLPKATIYFVGANPPSMLRNVATRNIVVTGAVDDIRPFIEGAAAIVAPLMIARGVQNKVLEAMAMRKPVVATREATRALKVIPGEHLWVENNPQRFADAVIEAIRSPARLAVTERARAYVETNHNWAEILSTLDQELEGLRQGAASDGCRIEKSPITRTPSRTRRTTGARA